MSTMERKEYQETKVMRRVSPIRNIRSSNQNLAQFDSNLDYLLEDLQNSVSRPGSSLANYKDSARSNSLSRISNVKSSNPVTEYSSDDAYNYKSPDGTKQISGYKKETYYKSSGSRAPTEKRMQNSINQLDSLLDDLQQVKKSSYSDNESYNNSGLDPDFVGKSKKVVNRELHYGDTPRPSSRTRTLERHERESSLTRDIQYSNEGTYGDIRQIRPISPSPSSRTSTLSKQTKVTNVHKFPVEVVETTTPDINPEILAHLDPNLHPPGNTKVTTTIKTYTYEIPGSGNYPTNLDSTIDSEKYVYSPNQSQTTPSKSFVYSKTENKAENYGQDISWKYREKELVTNDSKVTTYQPYQKPAAPGGNSVVKQTVTTRNYQPGYSPEPIPPPNQTYVYNETVTTRNVNDNYPKQPPQNTYFYEEKHDTVTDRTVGEIYPDNREPRNAPRVTYPDDKGPSKGPPRQQTYIIKEMENTSTVDTTYPPPSEPPYRNGYPPNEPNKTVIYKHETHTTNNYGNPPRNYDRIPNEPVNIHYKYKSESKTTNNYKAGYPPGDESQPLLPKPFPTDSQPDGPPKRLDELMATIGSEPPNSPYNAGYNAHEIEILQKKKIDSLKQQHAEVDDMQKKEPVPKSKNVSGPPVYYPPGHEMFAKKEEGGWRAEGAYGRESGNYKYEAEAKSKSKSSSGAAVVPVCLPLCCGLPCTIL